MARGFDLVAHGTHYIYSAIYNEYRLLIEIARMRVSGPEIDERIDGENGIDGIGIDGVRSDQEESMGSGPIEKRAAFLLALKVVANIHGDLRKLASDAHLNRESMYRMLAEKGNSRIDTLNAVLHVLGLRLSIVPEEKNSASAA